MSGKLSGMEVVITLVGNRATTLIGYVAAARTTHLDDDEAWVPSHCLYRLVG